MTENNEYKKDDRKCFDLLPSKIKYSTDDGWSLFELVLTPTKEIEEDDRSLSAEDLDGDPRMQIKAFVEQPAN